MATDERMARLKRVAHLYELGFTFADIGDRLGVAEATITGDVATLRDMAIENSLWWVRGSIRFFCRCGEPVEIVSELGIDVCPYCGSAWRIVVERL